MHLTQDNVGDLLPLLIHFYLTGELPDKAPTYKINFEFEPDDEPVAYLNAPNYDNEDDEL